MRISNEEKKAFIESIKSFLTQDKKAELRLYGSRLDDQKKGGDFDLLLICENATEATKLNLKLHYLLAEIKLKIGEQRIDLKITDEKKIHTDPFLRNIYEQSVLLDYL